MGWLLQEQPSGVCSEGTTTSVTGGKGVEDLVALLSDRDESVDLTSCHGGLFF